MLLQVLIVEDEEIIRKGLELSTRWLDMNCRVVGTAEDGVEGLEMIGSLRPDLVITDIRMPRLDGLSMLEKARESWDFSSIVLTSYSEFALAKQALHLGVVEYLLKPVDEDELREAIRKIRKRRRKEQIEEEENRQQGQAGEKDVGDFTLRMKRIERSGNPYVRQIVEIVKREYDSRITIQELSERLGVSPSYISRKLREELDCTFTELLNSYRVSCAVEQLIEGTSKIYEISDRLGFGEYKNLIRVFKRYTGMTPTDFLNRRSDKEKPPGQEKDKR